MRYLVLTLCLMLTAGTYSIDTPRPKGNVLAELNQPTNLNGKVSSLCGVGPIKLRTSSDLSAEEVNTASNVIESFTGLGKSPMIYTLEVTWTSLVQELYNETGIDHRGGITPFASAQIFLDVYEYRRTNALSAGQDRKINALQAEIGDNLQLRAIAYDQQGTPEWMYLPTVGQP